MLSDLNVNPSTALKVAVGSGIGVAGLLLLRSTFSNYQERKHFEALRKQRQKERTEQLEDYKNRFPLGAHQYVIVNLPFDSLCRKLQRRDLKAREVLEAFIAKAVEVTSEFNCITEFIPQCFEIADQLDARADVKGPLHGVPFCVKDDHDMKGLDSTIGCSRYLNQPASYSAVVVKVLMDAGAVPFCRTNLPQTTMSGDSHNPIYGTTLNPLNKELSPGGSSSGTASLVKAGGAHFGTGSDIAGSVRVPSHMCGIATLRPTIGRNSTMGMRALLQDLAGYTSVSGIMASNVKVLTSVNEVLWSHAVQNAYDPLVIPLPYNKELVESNKKLRIGYYTSMSHFPAIGDTPKTVLEAVKTLQKLGHTLVEFELPPTAQVWKVYSTLFCADGYKQIRALLKNDAVSHVAAKFTAGQSLQSRLLQSVLSLFTTPDEKEFVGDPKARNSAVLWEYLKKQRLLKRQILERMQDLELDAILGPVQPFPAPTLEDSETLIIMTFAYTAIWNLVDMPAGVLPFGTESGSKIDAYDDRGDWILKLAKKNAKEARGMPIGVQVIAKPFHEELVLRLLNELEDANTSRS